MGFRRSESGIVTIGGKDINTLSENDLTRMISIVQQEAILFNTTIKENIALGKKNASEGEILAVVQKAKLSPLILSLPLGLDTVIGEGGAKLSGGEKQRISIARMMLKDSPIIILDEATSALDPHNEQLINEAIEDLSKDKTVISIAHHMHTVANSDQIVLLDNGSLVANGDHNHLMENSSLYINMFKAQEEIENWKIRGDK